MRLGIIVGATRPGRQTTKQAKWVENTVEKFENVEAEIVDLKKYPMPFFNEAISPRYNPNRTIEPAVQKWLDKIDVFDAYIFVTPEYNHSIPGELKNAFDFITWELNRKPAAIVSHGTAGGARAAMHLKEILSEGKALPIPNFVALAGMSDLISEEGELDEAASQNPYGPQATLEELIKELQWTSDALAVARTSRQPAYA